jgi:hypothetical protein
MEAVLKAMLLREVNERIAELLERSWPGAPGEFLCECGRAGCTGRVTLPLADYRVLRHRGEAVVSPEHARATNRSCRRGPSGHLAAST